MNSEPMFLPGKELSKSLSAIIGPRLRELLPGVELALALIGPGSDVLGYDTARSMDHDWGPRLTIVVPEHTREDVERLIDSNLDTLLPPSVAGFSTRFSFHADGTMKADPGGTVHRLNVTSIKQILLSTLLIESVGELDDAVWLSTPMQSLLEITAGDVFVDDDGSLTRLRTALEFFPHEIWRYQLAGLWMRVSQIQPFVGRTGEVGDDVGSAQIAASISRDLMRIALLQQRRYAPYAKWLGSAFGRTDVGAIVMPHLKKVHASTNWQEREHALNSAGAMLIEQLNGLELIPQMPTEADQFHARPFHILPAEDIAGHLLGPVTTAGVPTLAAFSCGIDVITDSTDALNSPEFRLAVRQMFRGQGS